MNKIIEIGRLTRDPEMRKTAEGTSVTNFSIAVDRRLGKNAEHPEADFFDCVAWSATADFVSKYFSKGMKIGIDGHLQSRKWQDKEGNDRRSVEIVADNVEFVESKKTTEPSVGQAVTTTAKKTSTATKAQTSDEFAMVGQEGDDLPF